MAYVLKVKTTTGAPALADLIVGEGVLVAPDDTIYYKKDDSTLIEFSSGGGGGSHDSKEYCVTGSGTNMNATATQMNLAVEQIANANYSLSANEITISEAGNYLMSWTAVILEDSTAGGQRGRIDGYLTLNGGKITQSESRVYTRETSGGTGLSSSSIVAISANDVIALEVFSNGTGDPDNSLDMAQVSIIKL